MLKCSMREIAIDHQPIDDIEPEIREIGSYREAPMKFRIVMELAYDFVVQSERPKMAMQQVGVALGLPSALKMSEIQLGCSQR
jgi:hypothetical protein